MHELPPKTEAHFCEEYLATWAAWKKQDTRSGNVRAGSVGECYTSLDNARARSYAKLDLWIAQRTDDAIQDLGKRHPAQKAALYHVYGVASVFNFPRANLEALLREAKKNVIRGLKLRAVWFGE